MTTHLMSYQRFAHTPALGTRWVWELEYAHARCLIEVQAVAWNGEQWWIETVCLLGDPRNHDDIGDVTMHDLDRFTEAVTPVGGGEGDWIMRPAETGKQSIWKGNSS